MAKNVLEIPDRALDITASIATAAASVNLRAVLSTLRELSTLYGPAKGFLSWKIF